MEKTLDNLKLLQLQKAVKFWHDQALILKEFVSGYEVGFDVLIKILNGTSNLQGYENHKFKPLKVLRCIAQVLRHIKTYTDHLKCTRYQNQVSPEVQSLSQEDNSVALTKHPYVSGSFPILTRGLQQNKISDLPLPLDTEVKTSLSSSIQSQEKPKVSELTLFKCPLPKTSTQPSRRPQQPNRIHQNHQAASLQCLTEELVCTKLWQDDNDSKSKSIATHVENYPKPRKFKSVISELLKVDGINNFHDVNSLIHSGLKALDDTAASSSAKVGSLHLLEIDHLKPITFKGNDSQSKSIATHVDNYPKPRKFISGIGKLLKVDVVNNYHNVSSLVHSGLKTLDKKATSSSAKVGSPHLPSLKPITFKGNHSQSKPIATYAENYPKPLEFKSVISELLKVDDVNNFHDVNSLVHSGLKTLDEITPSSSAKVGSPPLPDIDNFKPITFKVLADRRIDNWQVEIACQGHIGPKLVPQKRRLGLTPDEMRSMQKRLKFLNSL